VKLSSTGAGYSQEDWQNLLLQFGNGCALCGSDRDVAPDLVLPVELGGLPSMDNVQPLCAECLRAKGESLVDYRPFVPRGVSGPLSPGSGTVPDLEQQPFPCPADATDVLSRAGSERIKRLCVPKMLTQKMLLAVESECLSLEGEGLTDPILEQEVSVELLLVEEIKRLRALIVENLTLARVESRAWKDRYANLSRGRKTPRAS
jgi:hypothetical protein